MYKEVNYDNNTWVQCICDNCGAIACDEEEGADLMPDKLSSHNLAMEHGWEILKDETCYCPNCIINDEE